MDFITGIVLYQLSDKTCKVLFSSGITADSLNLTCVDIDTGNEIFSSQLISKINDSGSHTDKVFTPLVTLKAFLLQVLSDDASCKEAVARVQAERLQQALPTNSMNTGPYCKARQMLSLEP